jgi:hypothetical protein
VSQVEIATRLIARPEPHFEVVELPTGELMVGSAQSGFHTLDIIGYGLGSKRIAFLCRLFLVLGSTTVAGGVASALLGIERHTVVEIVSWMLIAAGVSRMVIVLPEWAKGGSPRTSKPTFQGFRDR